MQFIPVNTKTLWPKGSCAECVVDERNAVWCGVRHISLLVWLMRHLWFLRAGCQSWLASCPDIRIVKAHC